MSQSFQNTDFYRRSWLNLTDPRTGSTLGLEPGEVVELDLPDDFSDPYLRPLDLKQPKLPQAAPKASQSPPAETAAPATAASSDDQKEA